MSSNKWSRPSTEGRPLAVIGAGVLGQRIACTWLASGYDVNLFDLSESASAKANQYITDNAPTFRTRTRSVKPGKLAMPKSMADAVADAWLVIESVPEKQDLKTDVFGDLIRLTQDSTILCTNSSSFKSGDLISRAGEGVHRICNMHYMMPPMNQLVELMTDGHTQEEIFPFLEEKLKDIGLHPIRAYKQSNGFIVNRVWAAIKRECLMILDEGVCPPEELDSACVEMFGFHNRGPCSMMDAVGLDIVAQIEEHYIKERELPTGTVDFLHKHYISQGNLGEKSGQGLLPPKRHVDTRALYFLDLGVAAAPSQAFTAGRVIAGSTGGDVWKVLVDHETTPDGITISKGGRLFWTQMGTPGQNDGQLRSCKLDGSDVTTVIAKGKVNTLKQVIVHDDGEKEQLYFCDREGMKVWRSNLDGSGLEILIEAGDPATQMRDQTRHCVGVAVSKREQKLYWTQKGASKAVQGRIMRANLALPKGQDAKTRDDIETVLHDLPEPIDLEIDEEGGFLYWTDRGELPFGNSINRAALSGLHTGKSAGGRQGSGYQIVARNLHEAIGLALDTKNRHIYSTDLGGSVYRFDMDADSIHQADMKEVYRKQGFGAFTGIALGPP